MYRYTYTVHIHWHTHTQSHMFTGYTQCLYKSRWWNLINFILWATFRQVLSHAKHDRQGLPESEEAAWHVHSYTQDSIWENEWDLSSATVYRFELSDHPLTKDIVGIQRWMEGAVRSLAICRFTQPAKIFERAPAAFRTCMIWQTG